MILQCENRICGKRTTQDEAEQRVYLTGYCGHCGGTLKKIFNMDGKSQAWRDAADRLLESLAKDNRYIVSDMMIVFLESAGYGLDNYSALGGVFKRAAKKGIIARVPKDTKPALWCSKVYQALERDYA